MSLNSRFYNDFHRKTSIQSRIIEDSNFTYRNIIQILKKYFLRYQPKIILDIGCGSGAISLYLADKTEYVYGIDVSSKVIQTCIESAKKLKIKNISFYVMNFPYEIPKEQFDFIICSEVLEHLEDDKKALRKIFNLLKKDGIAFISVPSIRAPLNRLGLTKKFDKEVGHLRRYAINDLTNKCKMEGFKIIEIKKTEGILRNFLFINPVAGKFIQFIKFFISDLVTMFDNSLIDIFGESNYFVVLKKP